MRTGLKMKLLRLHGVIIVHTVLALSMVQAADLTFTTGGHNSTYNCNGRDVFINSAGNSLRFTGYCHSVTVRGTGNRVIIDSVDRIATQGTNNTVHWRSERKPLISNTGSNNVLSSSFGSADDSATVATSSDDQGDHQVVATNGNGKSSVTADGTDVGGNVGAAVNSALQAAGAATAAAGAAGSVNTEQTTGNTLNLVISGRHITRDCGDGKVVNINGYENDITLTGRCGSVALNGWGNHLYIEETASIQVSGHTNAVTWARTSNSKRPSTSVLNGYDNSIRQGDLPNR